MFKKLLVLLVIFSTSFSVKAQCTYTGSPTQVGGQIIFCVDNTNTQNINNVNAGQYLLVNVVSGFTYTFSVGNVFNGKEYLTILNAVTNSAVAPAAFVSGGSGCSLTWTANFSGQIKVLLSAKSCDNDNTTGGTITAVLNSVGNNFDSQTAFGTNTWVGHVYNYTGGSQPGGNASPAAPTASTPFSSAEYVGNYAVATENFTEGFGGGDTCFPVFSNGTIRTNIYTSQFAVRYRMKSTKVGCYLINANADDGVRIYVDGALVMSQWQDQGPTDYNNVLVYLNGNSDIVLDFYENGGGNTITFNMSPFLATSNTVAPASVAVCSNNSPGLLNATSYVYNGGTTNPSISFQWQSSTDNISFVNISGSTSEDYTPPTQTTASANVVFYYRRVVKGNSASASTGCVYNSNSVKVTTSSSAPSAVTAINGLSTTCPSVGSQVYTAVGGTNGVNYNWTVPTGWTIISGAGTNSITVSTGTNGQNGNIGVTVSNGCGSNTNFTKAVTVGATTTTWNGTAWSTTPSSTSAFIFNGNYSAAADLVGCSCTVNSGFNVTIPTNSSMTVQDFVVVNGTGSLTFENNAPLIQFNATAANAGIIKVKRNSTALKRLDYTLWSSPVVGQNILSFSPLTFNVLPSNVRFYRYNTTANNYTKIVPSSTNFATGAGYLIRMPDNHPTSATVWNGLFTGTPNNGTLSVPVSYVSNTQAFNTVGNPYPSPISLLSFVAANASTIDPTIYFWRKTNTVVTNTGYSTWNNGTFTAGSQFNTSANPNNVLQTGQGFMVKALPGVSNIVFNNTMRVLDKANQFFRMANQNPVQNNTVERNYFWLNLTGSDEQFSQVAIGYRTNATDDVDDFDAVRFSDGAIDINAIINQADYTIQSKALPFLPTDAVPLSIKIPTNGTYTIQIDHTEGLFDEGQDILLKDNLFNTITNLTTSGYEFAATAGYAPNRFEIIYKQAASVVPNISNDVLVYKNSSNIIVNAGNQIIKDVLVYDLRGRLLTTKLDCNSTEVQISYSNSNQLLLVKTIFENGETITKKLLQ